MKHLAHYRAVEDLLTSFFSQTNAPADAFINGFFRQRRYMGSKDKAVIAGGFYHILRNLLAYQWGEYATGYPEDLSPWRGIVLLWRHEQGDPVSVFFESEQYGLSALSERESAWYQSLDQKWPQLLSEAPEYAAHNIPEWLLPRIKESLGNEWTKEVAALNDQASFDLRVNTLKTDRESVLAWLHGNGVEAYPTSNSPVGIRLTQKQSRSFMKEIPEGWVEIQDEASQCVSFLLKAKPQQRILDLCAGAGGKSLALAAQMENKGQLVATDISSKRLERAKKRARSAGVFNMSYRGLSHDNPLKDSWFHRQQGKFDAVFLDAPCSGTGTWRRNPDLKWRGSADDLEQLKQIQAVLLDAAMAALKPGGRLVYVTCSVLEEENQHQITRLLESNAVTIIGEEGLFPDISCSPYFTTTPLRHQMDGFFAACLQKSSL